MASKKKKEVYIVTTDDGGCGEVCSTKDYAQEVIVDLMESGNADADQIHVYKGVEVLFDYGVNIKE